MTEDVKMDEEVNKEKSNDEHNGNEVGLQEYSSWSDTKQTSQNPTAMKRKIADVSPVVPQKKKKVSGPPQVKNAVQTLNEYKAGLEYEVISSTGPSHAPNFVVGVTLNGSQFTGVGGSKKAAKQAAAENALKSLIQFKNPVEAQAAMGIGTTEQPIDFTADDSVNGDKKLATNGEKVEESTPSNGTPQSGKKKKAKKHSVGANPMQILNENKPGLTWECSEKGSTPATKKFSMKTVIDGETYEGCGVSKKLAKNAAAKSILNKLFNMDFSLGEEIQEGVNDSEIKVAGTDMVLSEFSENQSIADNIGRLILEKYDELMVGHSNIVRRKVIAGIVMTLDVEMKKMVVLCVSTGTKCISGEYMSVSGTGLNDCHAEIISRRCLMDYIYSQLEKILSNNGKIDEESILVESESGGYRIKDNVRFHLYINTAPCGDARIFSPHEETRDRNVYGKFDDHPKRKARGQLRTKIESGEGTIPVKNSESIQTWDGVMQGSRLLTMSCADKVARWNVLGLQGSLLAYFLEPIYLHSVVLGSLFHPTHMYRALTGRVKDTLNILPEKYRLNTPKFNLMTSKEVRNPGKGPNYSVNWTIGSKDVEVIDAMKGKAQDTQIPSRLCKYAMFQRWNKLASSDVIKRIESIPSHVPDLYSEAKQGSKKFQEAKKALFKAFSKAELGDWIKKPMEQDEFEI